MSPQRTFDHMTWQEALKMEDKERFIIPGLVVTTSTLLVGEPKAGKSLIAAGIVASLITGEPFLNREVETPAGGWKVAICWTDDAGVVEYRDRLLPVLPTDKEPAIEFYSVPYMKGRGWQTLYDEITDDGCNIVIFDLMHQAMDGDPERYGAINEFFRGIRQFTRSGIPTIVIAHSSEKQYPNQAKSKSPLGSTGITGSVRWRMSISLSADGEWSLYTKGAGGDEPTLKFVAPEFDVPRFRVTSEQSGQERRLRAAQRRETKESAEGEAQAQKQMRSKETLDKNATIARWVADNCQGLSLRKTAAAVAKRFGGSAGTARNNLSGSKAYGALLKYRPLREGEDGMEWALSGPLAQPNLARAA